MRLFSGGAATGNLDSSHSQLWVCIAMVSPRGADGELHLRPNKRMQQTARLGC
jgi:hypothetical protein